MSDNCVRPPKRPGYGTLGHSINLYANYFQLNFQPDLQLHRYEVRVSRSEPDAVVIVSRQVVTQVILQLLKTELVQFQESIASDGYQNLISSRILPCYDGPYNVVYQHNCYQVTLLPAGILQFPQLYKMLRGDARNQGPPLTEAHIHALNIILGHQPKFSPHIRSAGTGTYLNLDSRMSLGSGLHILRGLFIVAREAQGRLFVNAAPKIAICYDDCPLDKIILMHMRQSGPDMNKVAALLRNLRVQLTHLGMRKRAGKFAPRLKTVMGLAAPGDGYSLAYPPKVPCLGAGAKEVQFFRESRSQGHDVEDVTVLGSRKRKRPTPEGYITIFEYFRSVYNITVSDPWLPVVNVGSPSNPSYLPAQVCLVLPGQSVAASIAASQSRQGVRIDPSRRGTRSTAVSQITSIETELSDILGMCHPNRGANLTSFGITVAPSMARVSGRVLDSPALEYRQGQRASVRAGGWNLRGMKFAGSTSVSQWTYLWLSTPNRSHGIGPEKALMEVAIRKFRTHLKSLGLNIPEPSWPGIYVSVSDSALRRESDADKLAHALAAIVESSMSFLLIILPQAAEGLYSRIKFLCDVQFGIRNVCVVADKFLRSNEQFLSNVALKLNLKLGGINQKLLARSLDIISDGKTMVVGVDVTHPNSGNLPARAPSVAAMVASVDRYLAQWPAEICTQPARQELVTQLGVLLTSRLHAWQRRNHGKLPENILLYRDGVSDTQYGSVLSVELPQLRKACRDLYGSLSLNQPRITIVIVGKRHHTRFFTPTRTGQRNGRSFQDTNPPNGTIVDHGPAISSRVWDFYLQSHTASRGTARPAHYVVLLDEIFQSSPNDLQARAPPNPANAIQALTHNICYVSGRATRASSICPPVFYADLACFRARFYVEELLRRSSRDAGYVFTPDQLQLTLHENVKDTMFYI
ncbi:RNA interference and gene silencing protein [Aspergillus eucalypticola CBS 122712]|uniref:RNA interference and gene silencing protein n=1 Tax=Aspergillus eucalypticola (strain CBS 122712 / IBT 29274) TaxID=1448314 RepID=A0A317V3M3_ASPEC|nr:RNA interference and gene silencing protein [Aspergillus eucalypticola CBS 122712]PWY68874.1 RNA interference and gene silencing protein [Aspergillus eucalypticola CBS 122712]